METTSLNDKLHMSEQLDERCRWLRIRRKCWIVPAAMVIGAAVCFLAYFIATTAFGPARSYKAVSKLYLTFAYDEQGNAKDYYNGATWTDLLTSHPGIYENILKELPEGTDLETVKEEVTAEILTDIRLMTVTVTDSDPTRADEILTAVDDALVEFGNTSDVFDKIEYLSSTPAALVTYTYRTRNAVCLGLFLGAVIGLFVLLIGAALDDAVYVPEEAERRYGLPAAGVKLKDGSFYGETKTDYDYLTGGKELPVVKAGGKAKTAERSSSESASIDYEALRAAGSVLAEIPCGVRNGTETEHLLSTLAKQDVEVKGLLITGADERFLDSYYRRDRRKAKP